MNDSITTVSLHPNIANKYIMKIHNMKLTHDLKSIRAFFTLTIGALQLRSWKLKQDEDNVYSITSPGKEFINEGKTEYESLIHILDPELKLSILKLALRQYNMLKGDNQDADSIN